MEDLLEEFVSDEDLKKFEKEYHEQQSKGTLNSKTQFEYAWCLVRSRYPADIKRGVMILEELLGEGSDTAKRDYLFYLAVGNAKLKEYALAKSYTNVLLQVEPGNRQVKELQQVIQKRMDRDGLKGIAIAGGGILALGAIVGLGIALSKK